MKAAKWSGGLPVILAIGTGLFSPLFGHGADLFVDNTLAVDCAGTYSISERACNGSDGDAFTTLQRAADATAAGDVVHIRGGDYADETSNCGSSGYCYILFIGNSGTDENPIVYTSYGNEHVSLVGFGFEDRDLNGDGYADGPADVNGTSVQRETLVVISADHVQMRNLELSESAYAGLSIRGSHNLVEGIHMHDVWTSGILIGYNTTETKIVENNVVRGNEIHNARHGSGVLLGRSSTGTFDTYLNLTRGNLVGENLSYHNGYLPNGAKVLPILGDPVGGGNSDGVGASKICHDSATPQVSNWCPGNTIRNNIVFHNADDGFDFSLADSVIEGNVSFDNGPEGNRGYKILRYVASLSFFGNIAMTNDEVGFELRVEDGSPFEIYHNAAIRNLGTGLWTGPSIAFNNVSAFNDGADLSAGSCLDCSHNWTEDTNGDPMLVDGSFTVATTLPAGAPIDARRRFILDQFVAALSPQADSLLVDAGRLIAGYHCPTAGAHPDDACREWSGSAPDIGVYEYGAPFFTDGFETGDTSAWSSSVR